MRSKNIINTNIVILFIYLSSYILPPATIWVLTYAIVGMAILIGGTVNPVVICYLCKINQKAYQDYGIGNPGPFI